MPLFDFYCKNCELEFELLLMGSDKPLCPHCGQRNLEKKMSSFSVRGGTRSGGSGGSQCSGCSGGSCSSCH